MYVPLDTVRHVVSFVDSVATVPDHQHFADSSLPRLAAILPCDVVTYHEVDLTSGRLRRLEFRRPTRNPAPSAADGAHFQATLSLRPAPDLRAVVALGRAVHPFSDVEHDVLEVVAAPLTAALRRLRERDRAVPRLDGDIPLTVRERQVVGLVARGRTNDAIAHELAVSPRTVAKHLEHVYRKLEVAGRAAAVARLLGQTPRPGLQGPRHPRSS
ncbi:helix-turn-helix transcriptional regulator [Saccharomonospora iraqiensis]|uniref:helix-turn-helix transcriptional regulator n=1 Tax=Saccharomonospora iraqiensis TaxID=52698 RepID=UPI00022E0EBC|nr:helix-turn-helix transcriptional regulator [Saccharomonospora iraqiensis]